MVKEATNVTEVTPAQANRSQMVNVRFSEADMACMLALKHKWEKEKSTILSVSDVVKRALFETAGLVVVKANEPSEESEAYKKEFEEEEAKDTAAEKKKKKQPRKSY